MTNGYLDILPEGKTTGHADGMTGREGRGTKVGKVLLAGRQ